MTLPVGTRLGTYEITASIGAGGMGEVYRARDTSLNRDVAIKVLLAGVATDPDRLARFRREAEVLASLNHPNIAQVYGVEASSAGPAMIMELVDGLTLDDVIADRPMLWTDALPIARQISSALESAHERGIIHRDLKPANIKITDAGLVKVLDFGLAKAIGPETDIRANLADSPTLTAQATAIGMILGTAAYMAPEQAKGRPVDRRADIWAFGAVLFEILTARRVFAGDDVTEVLASVLKSEPDWDALPKDTPPAARRLLRRCLEKDPKRRLRDIAEGMMQLDEGLAEPAASGAIPQPAGRRPLWLRALPVVACTVTTAVLVSAAWHYGSPPVSERTTRITLRPPGLRITMNPRPHIGITADGRILYQRRSEIGSPSEFVVKHPEQFEAEPLEGAGYSTTPFMSPDGEWIGLIVGGQPDSDLFKIPARGGPRTPIATSPQTRVYGAAWAPDDTIVFGTTQGLFKIPPGSDKPVPLTTAGGSDLTGSHTWPTVVGSSGLVVFSIRTGDEGMLAAAPIATGTITPLQLPGTSPRYVSTGHIVYATSDGVLRAVPFDPARIAVTGPSVPLESGVYVHPASGAAEFDVSVSGTLVFLSADQDFRQPVWVNRQRNESAIPAEAGVYTYPRLSPDDKRLSLAGRNRELDIFTWEFARPGLRRIVQDASIGDVLWAADGTIVYSSWRDGRSRIYRRNADGTGQPSEIFAAERTVVPQAIVPDGSALIVRHRDDIALVRLKDTAQLETLATGASNASLSPNGAWLAYETGKPREVVVRPFPNVKGGSWTVARGNTPLWSRDGSQLFYAAGNNMMAATIETVEAGPSFTFRPPVVLFPMGEYGGSGLGRSFDVAKDGRFLMIKSLGRPDPVINVVYNWFSDVSARVKAR